MCNVKKRLFCSNHVTWDAAAADTATAPDFSE